MLNRDSIIVLKKLTKINFEYKSLEDFCALLPKMEPDNIEATLYYLDEKGYLNCGKADNTIYDVYPTYEGAHYFQFKWAEIKSFLIRSIFTPIVVSFATTVLALLISA